MSAYVNEYARERRKVGWRRGPGAGRGGEAEPGRGLGPAAPLEGLRVPAPAQGDARAGPRGREKRAPGLAEAEREAGFDQVASRYWLTRQNFTQSTRSLPSPPPRPSPACLFGGGRRLLVSLATVRGPRRPGNGTRPPVSSRPGPLRSPRQPLPVRVTHRPFPRHPGNLRRSHLLAPVGGHLRPGPRCLGLLRPIAGLRGGPCSHPGRVFWHWSPSRAACLHSCVGLSVYHRELFRMQAMSLPC